MSVEKPIVKVKSFNHKTFKISFGKWTLSQNDKHSGIDVVIKYFFRKMS